MVGAQSQLACVTSGTNRRSAMTKFVRLQQRSYQHSARPQRGSMPSKALRSDAEKCFLLTSPFYRIRQVRAGPPSHSYSMQWVIRAEVAKEIVTTSSLLSRDAQLVFSVFWLTGILVQGNVDEQSPPLSNISMVDVVETWRLSGKRNELP